MLVRPTAITSLIGPAASSCARTRIRTGSSCLFLPTAAIPPTALRTGGTYDPYAKEIQRDNEMIFNANRIENITDSDLDPRNAVLEADFYQPCVVIPVQDMNISEPGWGWAAAEKEAALWGAAIKSFHNPTAPTGADYFYLPRRCW